MPAQYLKSYVKTNKNDYLDAEAIAEAVQRPTMRFVLIKNDAQLDLQALHRVRDRWVARRTAVMNQIHGFLLDRGIAIRKGPSYLAAQLQVIFSDGSFSFSGRLLHLVHESKHEWDELERKIEEASAELARVAKEDDGCHRLMEVPGFGPLSRRLWWRRSATGSALEKDGTWQPGWGWFHGNTRPEARPDCSASANSATST